MEAYNGLRSINRLPDEVLSNIVSFLPLKDAVRTSVLSKRWRYIYTSSSNLVFDFGGFLNSEDSMPEPIDVIDVVNKVLFARSGSPINKFFLGGLDSQPLDLQCLESWISDLTLHDSIFEIPTKVSLPSLKELHLDSAIPFSNDNSAESLLSNCPILEHLFYMFRDKDCKFFVSHPTLKSLSLDCMCKEGRSINFEIAINAPSLVFLKYNVQDVNSHNFVNVQSLTEADIGFYHKEVDHLRYTNVATDLLKGISKVQKLAISVATLEDLLNFGIPIPVLHNLSHLTLFDCNDDHDSSILLRLLARCESLETLVFKVFPDKWNLDALYSLGESRISCLLSRLKTIEIEEFGETVFGEIDNQMELVKYLMSEAKVLESVKVQIAWGPYEAQLRIANKLSTLPRASKTCGLLICYKSYNLC
ncbi:hypothetical protein SLEP1_g36269 [Rubroshorea leprosula]|uniref:F-box domain-containing protein n=1 Tax=Rubroshorea leprosula TaxID=152421 RepID=A0AAV5KR84_9ROSI|nr:hypothetical protein SLEP1_g36269 [Rubroshorea leprosula]